jgi:hypothetical protein
MPFSPAVTADLRAHLAQGLRCVRGLPAKAAR